MNWVDTLSLAAWGSGLAVGLFAGLMRVWLPLLFLMVGMGFGGALGEVIGPAFSPFIDSERGQTAAAFLVVFAAMMLFGAFITLAAFGPLTIASSLVSVIPMGATINKAGGVLLGLLFTGTFLAVVLIGLQQIPVKSVSRAIDESSIASAPLGWVDRYVASIEISDERDNFD